MSHFKRCAVLVPLALLFAAISFAEERNRPISTYRSDLCLETVTSVRHKVRTILESAGLEVVEKYGPDQNYITEGGLGFISFAYAGDVVVLTVSNLGVGNIISINIFEHGKTPSSAIVAIGEELMNELSSEFRLSFKEIETVKKPIQLPVTDHMRARIGIRSNAIHT